MKTDYPLLNKQLILELSDGFHRVQKVIQISLEWLNHLPEQVKDINYVSIERGQSVSLTLAPYFSDPDQDRLTITTTSENAEVNLVNGAYYLTVQAVDIGQMNVLLTVDDNEGGIIEATARFGVSPATKPINSSGGGSLGSLGLAILFLLLCYSRRRTRFLN